MGTVTIYRFKVYDVNVDEMKSSRRWGTRDAVEKVARGQVVADTAIEVDESRLDPEMPGFTARGFDPRRRDGFQTEVSR